MTDVFASPRDAGTVFVTLNNYQRGDYKPYIVKHGQGAELDVDLRQPAGAFRCVERRAGSHQWQPALCGARVRRVVHGRRRPELDAAEGGIPTTQARDLVIQRRENDLVVGTFGRGAFILDDYSALRDLTPAADRRGAPPAAARRLPVRGARAAGSGLGKHRDAESASRRDVHLHRRQGRRRGCEAGDHDRRRHRPPGARFDVPKTAGVNRATWNLRGDPPRGEGRGGGRGGPAVAGGAERPVILPAAETTTGSGFRRPWRTTAGPAGRAWAVSRDVGASEWRALTPIGAAQTFQVVALPK